MIQCISWRKLELGNVSCGIIIKKITKEKEE